MLAIAGGESRIENSTLTDDRKAWHTAKVNELLNMNKFGVVEVVDRPQSKQVLWVSKQRLDGSYKVRLVARRFEQTVSSDTDFHAETPKLTTLRARLTKAALHGHPVASGDCHSAFHQSPMPTDSEPVYRGASTGSTAGLFQGMALQESFSRPQDFSSGLGYSQHTKNQRQELQPVDIRSFDVCEETCTTIRRFDPPASHG